MTIYGQTDASEPPRASRNPRGRSAGTEPASRVLTAWRCARAFFSPHPHVVPLCRHVILPTDVARLCPKNKLLSEQEWRNLNVQQSRGWEHYAVHK